MNFVSTRSPVRPAPPSVARSRRAVVLGLSALLLGLCAWPAAATTVVRQTWGTLTAGSDCVVLGRVESLVGHAEAEGHPFRLAAVRVTSRVAGGCPDVVHVRVPGGIDVRGGDWRVPGAPELVPGDEVLLFLERVPLAITTRPAVAPLRAQVGRRAGAVASLPAAQPAAEQWTPLSLALGSYRVTGTGDAAEVLQDESAAALSQVGPVASGAAAPARAPLAEALAAVRAAAAPATGGRR